MKKNKIISFDEDVFGELAKEPNASAVVNGLCKDYYGLKGRIEIGRIEREISDAKILHAENLKRLEEKLVRAKKLNEDYEDVFGGIPDEIITDFRLFPRMTEEVCRSRYGHMDDFGKILKAYRAYFKK